MMKRNFPIQIGLFLFGLIALGIGFALTFFPVRFEASAHIILDKNSSLLSEMRAFGGLLFSGGLVIFLGALKTKFMLLSLGTSALLYLSVAFGRIIGMLIDGMPSQSIVMATIIEIAIGIISLFLLFRVQNTA